jgi:hypothetical protein
MVADHVGCVQEKKERRVLKALSNEDDIDALLAK